MRQAIPLLLACAAFGLAGCPPAVDLPPIVFVSRPHMDRLDANHVGPPVDVTGREHVTDGGGLMIRHPDGWVENLTAGTPLRDAKMPMPNEEGTRVVFAGATSSWGGWRIYEVDLLDRTLRQITFSDRVAQIPEDPRRPGANPIIFGSYSDFSPIYLADGRILFASSRYMSRSASCGHQALNLYIVNPDGSGLHRVTTERSGAINPWLLENGMVLYSHWVDNMNIPSPDGPGLEPLVPDLNYQRSFWIPWVMNPDGTEEGRYGFLEGGLEDGPGGAFQMRSLPDGDVVYTYRGAGSLLGDTLPTAIARFTPGFPAVNSTAGIGDPWDREGPHALCPTPLPDGRILFSYTPASRVERDPDGRLVADFDYGLYVCDGDFTNLRYVYDRPGTEELYPVAVAPRNCALLPDTVPPVVLSDNPEETTGETCLFRSMGVYADVPLTVAELPSPMLGSVAGVDFYNDRQQFQTSEAFPEIEKQMPPLLDTFPVDGQGAFQAVVDSDQPVFYFLKTVTGVAARQTLSPTREDRPARSIPYLFANDYLRQGKNFTCTGCHRGHMVDPAASFGGRPNVARFAAASASSAASDFWYAPWRAKDVRLPTEAGGFAWASAPEDRSPWLKLAWDEPLPVHGVHIYLPPARLFPEPLVNFTSAVVRFSDGSEAAFAVPEDPAPCIELSFEPKQVSWMKVEADLPDNGIAALSEIAVLGDPSYRLPDLPPELPQIVRLDPDTLHLYWSWDTRGTTLGYRVHVRREASEAAVALDVGNVNEYGLRNLEPETPYRVSLEPYNAHGNSHGVKSPELAAATRSLALQGVEPARGPAWGEAPVTLRGEGFTTGGIRVEIGGEPVYGIQILDDSTLTGLTHHHKPGTCDVEIANGYGLSAVLADAYRYVRSGPWVALSANRRSFHPGDTLVLDMELANDGEAPLGTHMLVLVLRADQGPTYFYDGQAFVVGPAAFGERTLPPGFHERSNLLSVPVAEPLAPGVWWADLLLYDLESEATLASDEIALVFN